jgi:predicted nucleic acid-binding protein
MRAQPRVYLDTSVIGGCFDSKFAYWSSSLMRDFRIGVSKPVVSTVVEGEVADAPLRVREIYRELIDLEAELLAVDKAAVSLRAMYLDRGILSARSVNDGLHVALATTNRVDVLVSWNFRHIRRYDRIRLFNAVNLEAGYPPLRIRTPQEVAQHG